MLRPCSEDEFYKYADFAYELACDLTKSGYPTYCDGVKTKAMFIDRALKAFERETEQMLLFEVQGRVQGLIHCYWIPEDHYLDTVSFNVNEAMEQALAEFLTFAGARFKGYELFLGFPAENQAAVNFLAERGFECIEDDYNNIALLEKLENVPAASGLPCAQIAAANDGTAHRAEEFFTAVKDFLFAAHHEAQRAVNGFGFATGYRGIQHFNFLFRQCRADLLTGYRADGAGINKDLSGMHILCHTVAAKHNLLDLRSVGEHGDDHITVLGQLLPGAGMCTAGSQLIHCSSAAVIYPQLIASLQQIFCHGLAHDSQTDHSDFHKNTPLLII